MGIHGLWAELQEYGHDTALPRLHESIQALCQDQQDVRSAEQQRSACERIRVGIDISGWLMAAQLTTASTIPRIIFFRLCRLLSLPRLLPVFVFDGPARPSWKRGKAVLGHDSKNQQRIEGIERRAKTMIEAFGFVWIDAPGEAEAEMADLNRRGLLDAIVSDDIDCFLFGAITVVRNWSTALSGSKARQGYLQRQRSDPPLSDSETGQVKEEQRAALKDNLVSYFHSQDFPEAMRKPGGCLLVALLSGGDYQIEGLHKFGIKVRFLGLAFFWFSYLTNKFSQISIGLAEAGYGARLLEGVHKHLDKPNPVFEAPTLKPSPDWEQFMSRWRDDLREELQGNASGMMHRKFPSLAKSAEMDSLLATPDSLALLANYLWPVISQRTSIPHAGQPSVERIAAVAGLQLHWSRELILASLHRKVYLSCIAQHLCNDPLTGVARQKDMQLLENRLRTFYTPRSPSKSKSQRKREDSQPTLLTSYFSTTKGPGLQPPPLTENAEAMPVQYLLSIDKQRQHPSTGLLTELYVRVDVQQLVDLAEKGIKVANAQRTARSRQSSNEEGSEEDELQSTESNEDQSAPAFTGNVSAPTSPSKRKVENVRRLASGWLPRGVIEASAECRSLLKQFDASQAAKKKVEQDKLQRKAKREADHAGQTKLSTFYRSARKPAADKGKHAELPSPEKVSLVQSLVALSQGSPKTSPSKRKAVRTLLQSSDTPSSTSEEDVFCTSPLSSSALSPMFLRGETVLERDPKPKQEFKEEAARKQLLAQSVRLQKTSLQRSNSDRSGCAQDGKEPVAPVGEGLLTDSSVEFIDVCASGSPSKTAALRGDNGHIGSITISDESDLD